MEERIARLTAEQLADAHGDDPIDVEDERYGVPADVPVSDADQWADRQLRRVLRLKEAAAANDELMQSAIKELQERRKDIAARHKRAIDWHMDGLRRWQRSAHRGITSIDLPSGRYWTRRGTWDLVPPETQEEIDLVRAGLADEGDGLEGRVFEPQPDKFRSQELRKLVSPAGPIPVGEPGSAVELVWSGSGAAVEGVRGRVRPGQHGVQR